MELTGTSRKIITLVQYIRVIIYISRHMNYKSEIVKLVA